MVALLGGLELWRRASAPKQKLHRKSDPGVDAEKVEKVEKPETHSCHSSWDDGVGNKL